MEIKEVKRRCQEAINQNKALIALGETLDAAEGILATANAAKISAAALRNEMKPLEEKRDKITQEITRLEVHGVNFKNDLDVELEEYKSNHKVKMEELKIASEEEEVIFEGRNRGLKIIFSKLESDIEEKQKQLDDINTILNKKRG